jgi:hypothetical protein
MTMTQLDYETSGKNDDQQNKENQDKTYMTSKSDNCAHSYSLPSIIILTLYFFISEMLGLMLYLKVYFYDQTGKLDLPWLYAQTISTFSCVWLDIQTAGLCNSYHNSMD